MTQLGGPEVLHLVGWSAAGQLRTPAVQALPQPDAAEAHPLLETGATTGKVVLKP
jgi:NADPH:quinone reductase